MLCRTFWNGSIKLLWSLGRGNILKADGAECTIQSYEASCCTHALAFTFHIHGKNLEKVIFYICTYMYSSVGLKIFGAEYKDGSVYKQVELVLSMRLVP
jgi:hypothetical protein